MSDRSVPRLALVVFVDQAESPWLGGLRAGFRHCFVVLRQGSGWLACDPLTDRLELAELPVPGGFDLPGFYAVCGHAVLLGATRPDVPRRGLTLAPLTCVEIAKRLLGVRAARVITPWQLYRYLKGNDCHSPDVGQAVRPIRRSAEHERAARWLGQLPLANGGGGEHG